MIDIVFPHGNEKEFIDMAERLGFSSLCFVYDKPTKILIKSGKVELFSAVLSDLKSSKRFDCDISLVKSVCDDRIFFESSPADLIFGLEQSRRDSLHARVSGLDQVLCALARDNDKVVALDFSSLLNSSGKVRAELLGRMMQNVRFCRQFKVKLAVASFAQSPFEMRACHDLKALGISLGMHPLESKLALRNVYDKIKHNLKKKSPNYIAEGIEFVD